MRAWIAALALGVGASPATAAEFEFLGYNKDMTAADPRLDCSRGPECRLTGTMLGPFSMTYAKAALGSGKLDSLGVIVAAEKEPVLAWLTSLYGAPGRSEYSADSLVWRVGSDAWIELPGYSPGDGKTAISVSFRLVPPIPPQACGEDLDWWYSIPQGPDPYSASSAIVAGARLALASYQDSPSDEAEEAAEEQDAEREESERC